jgi:hypothetical protein
MTRRSPRSTRTSVTASLNDLRCEMAKRCRLLLVEALASSARSSSRFRMCEQRSSVPELSAASSSSMSGNVRVMQCADNASETPTRMPRER